MSSYFVCSILTIGYPGGARLPSSIRRRPAKAAKLLGGGAGLRLSVVRRGVELHKGAIRVRNAQPCLLVEIDLPARRLIKPSYKGEAVANMDNQREISYSRGRLTGHDPNDD